MYVKINRAKFGVFLDFIRIIEQAEKFVESQGFDKSNLAKKLGFPSRYIADIKAGKSKNPGSDFVLALINRLNFDPVWLETGKGEMFLTPKEEKHPLIADLEALIDRKLEAQLVEIENRLKQAKTSSNFSDSGMFVSEPVPEYGIEYEKAPFVDNIAAGPPIQQSEDLSEYIDVPRRFIKTKLEDYYAAHIRGESMTAAGIPDGCTVLIRRSDVPRDGAIQVVRCGGKSTLKRMREGEDHTWTIRYEDNSERYISIGKDEEYQVQGDFVAVLPKKD
jgi:SOS-response transcriptional repressor LexA